MGKVGRTFSFPIWIRILLGIVALANLFRVFEKPLDANQAVDFRNVYVGQLLLVEGKNPYDDKVLKDRWYQLTQEEGIESVSEPGFPHNPLVYPPWALALFSPFSLCSYSVAYVIWYILIPVFLFVFLIGVGVTCCIDEVTPQPPSRGAKDCFSAPLEGGWGVKKLLPPGRQFYSLFLDLNLLALAFKGTVHAFIVCQPTFLCFAAIGGFLWAFSQKKEALAGVCLAIAAFKVSLVIPFVLWVVFQKEWKVLFWSSAVGAGLWLLGIFLSNDVMILHKVWLENMSRLSDLVFDQTQERYPIYFTMTQITELGTLMEYFRQGASAWRGWVYLVIWIVLILWLWFRFSKKKLDELSLLVILCLVLFLTTYHQFYDLLILLLIYPLGLMKTRVTQIGLFLICLPLFLPVNGFLNRMELPQSLWIFYFTTPLVVLILSVFLAQRCKIFSQKQEDIL